MHGSSTLRSSRRGLSAIGVLAGAVLAAVGLYFALTGAYVITILAACSASVCSGVSSIAYVGLFGGIGLVAAGVLAAWKL